MKITTRRFTNSHYFSRKIFRFLMLTFGLFNGLLINSAASVAASGTISFEDQGFAAGAVINDDHIFNVIGLQFKVYAANFDGTPSASGSLYYDPGDGSGPWNSYPTEFNDGGFVTADVTNDMNQRWIEPEALVIKTADGTSFQLKSFKVHDGQWDAWGNYIKVSGYQNGVLLGSSSFVITSHVEPYYSTVTLTDPVFANVDEVRITFDKDNSPNYSSQPQYDGLFHSFDTFVVESAVSNVSPTASNVTFTGTLKTGQTLTGDYDYNDPDSDPESGTTFKWYRSDNASGANKTAISNATSLTYTLVSADAGKYISFEVTPHDGTDAGAAMESSRQGPVSVPTPEIQIKGNSIVIANGDNTPASADHTDFGNIAAASGTISRTFTIQNTGDAILSLIDSDGNGFVTLGGTNAGDFSITSQPSETIAAGDSTTFTVQFDPNAIGLRSAIITIHNNDVDEPAFGFTVNGTGLNSAPVITSDGGGAIAFVNVGEKTTLVTMVTADDPDGDLPSFGISGGADQALFIIDASSGALHFKTVPDFENPLDAEPDGIYEVEVIVFDENGGVDIQTISITIIDEVEITPVITVNEGITVIQGRDIIISSAELQANDEDGDNDELVYLITSGPVNGQLELIGNPGIEITSFTQAQLNANQVVYVHNGGNTDPDGFTFDVRDISNNSLTGQTFTITVTLVTNVSLSTSHDAPGIYPNPVIDNLTLEFGNTGNREVVIFNSQGTEALRFTSFDEKASIDVSSLSAGVYHISLKSEKGISDSKFVKK